MSRYSTRRYDGWLMSSIAVLHHVGMSWGYISKLLGVDKNNARRAYIRFIERVSQ